MVGGGVTLAGGFKVTDWRTLTCFMVFDANYTYTDLDFVEDELDSTSKAEAVTLTPRVGLRGRLSDLMHLSVWGGAMHQSVSETIEGVVASRELGFVVEQKPVEPWNALVGMRLEVGKHVDLMIEGGFGKRKSIVGGVGYRF
jgi:hypothetical protein